MNDINEADSASKSQTKKQAIRNKNIAKSIARAEKDNSCDYEILTKHEIRCLLKATADHTCYASVLIRLSLLLGRSIESLLSESCVFIKPPKTNKHFWYSFIEVKRDFPNSHLSESEIQKIENKGLVCIPEELAELFEDLKSVHLTKVGIENIEASAKCLLKGLNESLGRRITLARIKRYFRYYCSHNGKSEVRFGVIAGKELGHHAGAYYTALQNRQIVELQTEYIEYLEEVSGEPLYCFATQTNTKTWGSLRLPNAEEINHYFHQLRSKCDTALFKNQLFDVANLYAAYTLTILQLGTGHRPEYESFGVVSMFDVEDGYVFIDDKKSGKNHHRIVKLCDTARQQLSFYFEHLRKLRVLSKCLFTNLHEAIGEILEGDRALLSYIKEDNFQFDKPLKIRSRGSFPRTLSTNNFYRHLLRTHLDKSSVDTDLIDWFFGHESKRDHSWARYSSLDFDNAKSVSVEIEKMFIELDITAYPSPLMRL